MAALPNVLAFFNNLAGPDLIVIGVIALLIFGKRLPEVGRSLGKGILEFKKGLADTEQELRRNVTTDVTPPVSPSTPMALPPSPESGQTPQ
ncbi:MAG TPA: twin-arginine translocase TatA/TatE family subunit [Phycisphaerae bacterium]|nr:twin-arginine translocase TatA/TatE family subunit [Phycisphaerae bacterium]